MNNNSQVNNTTNSNNGNVTNNANNGNNQPNNDNNTPVNANGNNTKKGMTAKDRFVLLLWVLAAIIAMALTYYFVEPFILN